MSESLKAHIGFPNAIVQSQTVRSLVAAVLKEKGPDGRISSRGRAMEALWEQCCSECAPVRSVCCDALVLLVEQGHADLQHVLDSTLNRLPSAANVQGLLRVIGRLLQRQTEEQQQRDVTAASAAPRTCPYSIGRSPHPYITALENRPDCWPNLLPEIDDYVRRAEERDEPAHVDLLAPFLRYVYCQPRQQNQHAPLRNGLLGVLLPPGGCCHDEGKSSLRVFECLLRCLCQMVPYMQVDSVESVLELHRYLQALLPFVVRAHGESWRGERARLSLQLLCVCHIGLRLSGSCSAPVGLLQQLLPFCKENLPVEELLTGLSLLLLEASAHQQTGLLTLALSLLPEEAELCPWAAPVLLLPLLQLQACSALTEPLADPRTHNHNRSLAHSLLRSVQKPTHQNTQAGVGLPSPLSPWYSRSVQKPTHQNTQAAVRLPSPLSSWYSQVQVVVHVLRRVVDDTSAASEWLLSITTALSSSQQPPKALSLIVAHLIVCGQAGVCKLALDVTQAIALADPSQAPSLLPVLLFRLGKERDPAMSHAVLSSLPNLCTHKLCVPQVLHVLQMLASAAKLRALVMRLMTALWVKHDRVYPVLQHMLLGQQEKWSMVVGKDTQWEHILARAACIMDICAERPYQHGADMLAAIAKTLNQCSKPGLASPVALVLRGLQHLCRTEVVDIVSSWRALGSKLSCDSRPLVVKAVAKILALVPQLTSKNEEYEKFREEAASLLWGYALSKDCEVAGCGYRALSVFPEVSHTVLHLPEPARPVAGRPEDEEDEKKDKEEDLSVPGSSYVKLLTITPPPVLPALEVFLTSLVRQEMEQMPRGVYHTAVKGAYLSSDHGKTVVGIPSFLLKMYEKNKQPGFRPGLADGVLLTYELPLQTDRRPIPRFLLSRSHSYQQMLTALIHEVNIQPSEWHRVLLLPRAWQGFMERAFHAILQGRHAELEMQQKKNGKESPENLQCKQCAWLWARDNLTDVINSAVKDNPAVQGNSILALGGLAAVIAKYESDHLPEKDGTLEVGPEIVSTSSWLSTLLETVLCVISNSYKPRGQVFPWLQHRSSSGENTSSPIARSCAALALPLVVPMLVSWHRDRVAEVLAMLLDGLPSQASTDDSQAVQFHSSLALGMVMSSLYQKHLSEVSAQTDANLMSCLDNLESCSFNSGLKYNAGCVLGLGLVLGALCSNGQAAHEGRVSLVLDKLLARLQDSSGQGAMRQEVLAYSVSCLSVAAFRGGLVDANKAEEVMNTLFNVTRQNEQTVGFSLALGLVVHGLAACGHGKAEDFHPLLQAVWIQILQAESCSNMKRLAAVNGLVALVGSESYIMQLNTEEQQSPQQQGRLNKVIRSITQILRLPGDVQLQSNCASLMGHLHLAHRTCSRSHTAVPQDFGYLPEKSVIRAIMDFVAEAGKKGPECVPPGAVNTALVSLASVGNSFQYPPVNWSANLSPLMRLNFGQTTQHQCVVLAASQVQTSPSASLFLGLWLTPPLVHKLSDETQRHLYETLATWMRHVAKDKLRVFLESLGVQHFQEELRAGGQRRALCVALLRGLERGMLLPDLTRHCQTILHSTVEKIYTLLPEKILNSHLELCEGLAKCLSALPDQDMSRITQLTETSMEKGCLLLTKLVSWGRVPLRRLNDVIAAVLRGWPSQRVGQLLLHTFYQCRLATGPNTGVSERMEWLSELMGYTRNIVDGATAVTCTTTQSTDFLLQVFAGAVAAWGDHHTPLLLGLGDHRLSWKPDTESASSPQLTYKEEALPDTSLSLCLLGLPHSLPRLLSTEPWSSESSKVAKSGHTCEAQYIDWLFSMAESPEGCLSATSITSIRAALLALKHSAEFKKKAVWTRAYGW